MTSSWKDKYFTYPTPKIVLVLIVLWIVSCEGNQLTHYNEDGTIDSEGLLVEGKKEGEWKFYENSGKLEEVSNWKDGEVNGISSTFYANGQLKSKAIWKSGLLDGLQQIWTDNGELWQEGNWKTIKKKATLTAIMKMALKLVRDISKPT